MNNNRVRNADSTRTKVAAPSPEMPVSADPSARMSEQGAGQSAPEIPQSDDTTVVKDKPVDKRQIAFWRGANEYPIVKCIITDNPRFLAGKLVAKNVDDAVRIFREWLVKELAK